MRKLIPVLLAGLMLVPATVSAREYDLSQLIVVDHEGNADPEEYIKKEDRAEERTEEAIAVFWDGTLKENATEEAIDTAQSLITKVCYLPRREEYESICDTAREMLAAKERAESEEQGKLISSIIQQIYLRYSPETKEKLSEYSYDEIEKIREDVKLIKDEEKRAYYNGVLNEMIYAR